MSKLTQWRQIRTRWWFRWPVDLTVMLAIFWLVSAWQTQDLLPITGQTLAPDFELPALDGQIYNLPKLQAKTTVLYFFAPWCTVCKLSIGNLQKLRQSVTAEELSIVIIALNWRSVQEVQTFIAEHELTVPVLLGTARTAETYHIKGFPTYYVLNDTGHIIERSLGYSTELGLRWRT